MKNLARFVLVAAVLGTVLVFSGCATPKSARAVRVQSVAEFTVVESSTNKELTPAQLTELREAVADYLREQGLSDNRLYYVKVSFPGDNPGDEEQWAIVRIGNLPTKTYTVLAAYPYLGPDDSYPYGYYSTGYAGFVPYGYYDPFDYNYGYYTRPVPRRDHKPDDRPGDKPDRPRVTPAGWDDKHLDPARRNHPGDTTTQPPGTRDHDRDRVRPDNPNPQNLTRNRPDDGRSRDWGRDRPERSGGPSASTPSYTLPPAPVRSDPPPRTESPSTTRSDKSDSKVNER